MFDGGYANKQINKLHVHKHPLYSCGLDYHEGLSMLTSLRSKDKFLDVTILVKLISYWVNWAYD